MASCPIVGYIISPKLQPMWGYPYMVVPNNQDKETTSDLRAHTIFHQRFETNPTELRVRSPGAILRATRRCRRVRPSGATVPVEGDVVGVPVTGEYLLLLMKRMATLSW